jgi:hypothetical protein
VCISEVSGFKKYRWDTHPSSSVNSTKRQHFKCTNLRRSMLLLPLLLYADALPCHHSYRGRRKPRAGGSTAWRCLATAGCCFRGWCAARTTRGRECGRGVRRRRRRRRRRRGCPLLPAPWRVCARTCCAASRIVTVNPTACRSQLLCKDVYLVVQRGAIERQLVLEVLVAQVHVLGPALSITHVQAVGTGVLQCVCLYVCVCMCLCVQTCMRAECVYACVK